MSYGDIRKIAPALLKAQKEMGAALKDAKNPFYKSQYADLGSVIDAAIPTLNANGIVVLQFLNSNPIGQPELTTMLLHESGEYIQGSAPIITKQANDPQAFGSAVTYTRRYGLQAAVSLKTEDDDGESAMNRKKGVQNEQSSTQTKSQANQAIAVILPTVSARIAVTQATASPAVPQPADRPSESKTPLADTKILRAKIKSAFAVLEAKKQISKKEFAVSYLGSDKDKVEKLSEAQLKTAIDKKTETITDEQVSKTLDMLKTKHPELGLN